jgi:hypothetical protein
MQSVNDTDWGQNQACTCPDLNGVGSFNVGSPAAIEIACRRWLRDSSDDTVDDGRCGDWGSECELEARDH